MYEWADLVDKQDVIRMLIDPQSAYVINAAMAMGRAFDEEFIDAFTADAFEGEEGTTVVPFPAGNIIETGGGGTGLTVSKIKAAKLAMDNVPVPEGNRWFVASPDGFIDLLSDPQVTSSDYNTVKALSEGGGTIVGQSYLGFQYVSSILLPLSGNIRQCYAWHYSAMGMLIGMELITRVGERADKSYSTQIYVAGSFKGVRVQDAGVRPVDIDESV